MLKSSFAVALLVCFFPISFASNTSLNPKAPAPPPAPLLVAVFGDSRTDGVFADMPLGQVNNKFQTRQVDFFIFMLKNILFVSMPPIQETYGSNTSEMVLDRPRMKRVELFLSRPNLSGLAGNRPYSLIPRLNSTPEFSQSPLQAVEFAEPGMSYRLAAASAATEMGEFFRTKNLKPALVVIELGAVDYLVNFSAAHFQQSVAQTLKRIVLDNPEAQIYLSGIPDIPNLFLDSGYPASYNTAGEVTATCQDFYVQAGYGKSLGLIHNSDPATVRQQYERLADFNAILQQQVDDLNDQALAFGFGGRLHLVPPDSPENVHDYLAFDCLHPNPAGQARSAEAFFNAISPEPRP